MSVFFVEICFVCGVIIENGFKVVFFFGLVGMRVWFWVRVCNFVCNISCIN